MTRNLYLFIIVLQFSFHHGELDDTCTVGSNICAERDVPLPATNKYSKDSNKWSIYLAKIDDAMVAYKPCSPNKCSCHYPLIKSDLAHFKDGISENSVQAARERGTFYQIIDHKLYREKDCMFPSRCSGIEHFILKVVDDLPDIELVVNTRDWPQVHSRFKENLPVFSFSKTSEYLDVTYPAWTFWEGGPAISLYPTGLGRWDHHRSIIMDAARAKPWQDKAHVAFFRGSRTSSERDPLIYLSRESPNLVDAKYTKNQAWKSEADTLYAAPAAEVRLEDHCRYRYLFNFRGVAASFRFKHLFLCGSLVFHVGNEWIEFFYPKMKPWVHYIPVKTGANKEEIRELIEFVQANEDIAVEIARRGEAFIREHLRMKDVLCYWRRLLRSYAALLTYRPTSDLDLIHIAKK